MPAAGMPTPSSSTSSWRPRGAEAAAGRSHARPNRTTRIAQRGEASSGGGDARRRRRRCEGERLAIIIMLFGGSTKTEFSGQKGAPFICLFAPPTCEKGAREF